MEKKQVLVVDDDPSVQRVLAKVLTSGGFTAVSAASGEEALSLLGASANYDLMILDINMPGIDGFEVVSRVREQGKEIPIIILSGRGEDYDTLYGLDLGADDYVTKPFNPVVLGAKVKALIRRNEGARETRETLVVGELTFNLRNMRLYKNGSEIVLSAKESLMIKLLMENVDRVFTKEQLYEQVWGDYIVDDNAITVYISHLRNKIETDPRRPAYIKTVWGLGYKLSAPEVG